MNKVFLYLISGLVVTVGVFGGLFYRDVVRFQHFDTSDDIDAGVCAPYAMEIKSITQSSFIVNWNTRSECSGYIVFGDAIDEANRMVIGEESLKKVSSQKVIVDNLLPDSTYYFYVVSGDTVYGDTIGLAMSVSTDKY